jgi:hypothetical protein
MPPWKMAGPMEAIVPMSRLFKSPLKRLSKLSEMVRTAHAFSATFTHPVPVEGFGLGGRI